MNILMLSSDDSVFSTNRAENQTILRLSRYLDLINKYDPLSSINVLVNTRFPSQSFSPVVGLNIIPICSKRIQWFPIKGYVYAGKKLKDIRFDLITCQNPFEIGLLGLLLKRKYRIPLEVQIHLNFFSPYWFKEHNFYNRFRYYLAKIIVKKADKIRVVSSSILDNLINRWGLSPLKLDLTPVPVFINNIHFEKKNHSSLNKFNNRIILFVGRLAYQKNLPALFKISQDILSLFNDVEFVIIGDGPLRGYAESKAREIHPNRIKLLGALPYSKLFEWYEKADLFLLPSYYEGLPRVLIESYLFKVPAIGSSCAGLQDIILDGQTGFLVDLEAVDLFTEKITWMIKHPDEAKVMGIKGYELVRSQFNPFSLVNKIVHEWKQLVIDYETNHDNPPISVG